MPLDAENRNRKLQNLLWRHLSETEYKTFIE